MPRQEEPKFVVPKVPTVSKIVIKHKVDENPDLSYLEQTYDDEEPKEREKNMRLDKDRLSSYNRDEWYMIGIQAIAEVLLPTESDPPSAIVQQIHSGGLWGIESDSGKEHIGEIEEEQVTELKGYLKQLNVKIPENVPVLHSEE